MIGTPFGSPGPSQPQALRPWKSNSLAVIRVRLPWSCLPTAPNHSLATARALASGATGPTWTGCVVLAADKSSFLSVGAPSDVLGCRLSPRTTCSPLVHASANKSALAPTRMRKRASVCFMAPTECSSQLSRSRPLANSTSSRQEMTRIDSHSTNHSATKTPDTSLLTGSTATTPSACIPLASVA